MSTDRKLLILVTIALLMVICFFVLILADSKKTEAAQTSTDPIKVTTDIEKKEYSAAEVRQLIKGLPEYQGDSLLIAPDGKLVSMDGKIQSVIDQIYLVPANIENCRGQSARYRLPVPYYVYRLAIGYYINQYGDKRKGISRDSVTNRKAGQ